MNKPVKIIFAGTPEFSVPYLEGLLNDPDFLVLGVITQPDRPSGRKQVISPSAIKIAAEKHNLKIWQPELLRKDPEIINDLKKSGAEVLIVVAYGQIIPQNILDIFSLCCINVHPSLLPKYRGASPIQSALLNGEKETGITIMLMDAQMDHGPILAQQKVRLTGEETNESLHLSLAESGAPLLISTTKKFLNSEIKPIQQNHDEATFCATITKDDARIDWSQPAQKIKQKIYAFYPWPATYSELDGERIKFFPPAKIIAETRLPGEVFESGGQIAISASDSSLIIDGWQMAGKTRVKNKEFLRGMQDIIGKKLK